MAEYYTSKILDNSLFQNLQNLSQIIGHLNHIGQMSCLFEITLILVNINQNFPRSETAKTSAHWSFLQMEQEFTEA